MSKQGYYGDPTDQAQWISILDQAACDARLRQGVEKMIDAYKRAANEEDENANACSAASDSEGFHDSMAAYARSTEVVNRLRALLAETETP